MNVTSLNCDDVAEVRELFALEAAVHAADCPDDPPPRWESFLAKVQAVSVEVRVERYAVRRDGRLAAAGMLVLPDVDNRQLMEIDVKVSPAYRRQGVGTALLERLCQRADEEGRRVILGGAVRPLPGGPARPDAGAQFLQARGFTPGLELVRRRIDLTAVDESQEQRLLAQCRPRAEEYELLSWSGVTPDSLASGVANLVNRLVTDAPTGELVLGETTVDASRLVAEDRNLLRQGTQPIGVAARHRSTGEVAAMTRIDIRADGDFGQVRITIADPKHRGHRLGTIVKIESHRLVRQAFPQLRYVYTGNADTNVHMAAINERLGFTPYVAGTKFQLRR